MFIIEFFIFMILWKLAIDMLGLNRQESQKQEPEYVEEIVEEWIEYEPIEPQDPDGGEKQPVVEVAEEPEEEPEEVQLADNVVDLAKYRKVA